MSRWDGLNRRKFPRVKYPCLIVVSNKEGEKETILTHTENLGIGGVCVILKQNLKIYSPVELELDLLDLGNHVKCLGKVVWNVQRKSDLKKKPKQYDIGIEFVNVVAEDQVRVDKIVSNLMEKYRKETEAK